MRLGVQLFLLFYNRVQETRRVYHFVALDDGNLWRLVENWVFALILVVERYDFELGAIVGASSLFVYYWLRFVCFVRRHHVPNHLFLVNELRHRKVHVFILHVLRLIFWDAGVLAQVFEDISDASAFFGFRLGSERWPRNVVCLAASTFLGWQPHTLQVEVACPILDFALQVKDASLFCVLGEHRRVVLLVNLHFKLLELFCADGRESEIAH